MNPCEYCGSTEDGCMSSAQAEKCSTRVLAQTARHRSSRKKQPASVFVHNVLAHIILKLDDQGYEVEDNGNHVLTVKKDGNQVSVQVVAVE